MEANKNSLQNNESPDEETHTGASGSTQLPANPVPVQVETISIDDYIKASVVAGDRVRRLLYILSFASAIAFMAYWNSKSIGWINRRFENIQEVEENYLDTEPKDTVIAGKLNAAFNCSNQDAQTNEFIKIRHINSTSKIKDYQKMFQDLKENTFKVNVPILGVFFDINDLSIFAGATFLFVLFLLSSSIGREEENLDFTFQFAVQNKILNKIYIYLTMGQVLSYPPKPYTNALTEYSFFRKILFFAKRHASKAFYVIPVIVESIIVYHDYKTGESGSSLNAKLATNEFYWSIAILVCIIVTSALCIYRTYKIDLLWDVYFKESTLDSLHPIV